MIDKQKCLNLLLSLAVFCIEPRLFAGNKKVSQSVKPKVLSWRQTGEFPHDAQAFTQGFEVWDESHFLESTGQYGRSELRRVNRKTGEVVAKASLEAQFFGEGVTRIGQEILQLTWREGLILQWIFGKKSGFSLKSKVAWSGEAWGITKSENALWLSDGTSKLFELDRKTLKQRRSITVTLAGEEFDRLNELEFVRGRIFANVFMSSTVVVINPQSGVIESMIDISTLLPKPSSIEAVANGLAWDAAKKRLYVTGKYWPKVYEVSLGF